MGLGLADVVAQRRVLQHQGHGQAHDAPDDHGAHEGPGKLQADLQDVAAVERHLVPQHQLAEAGEERDAHGVVEHGLSEHGVVQVAETVLRHALLLENRQGGHRVGGADHRPEGQALRKVQLPSGLDPHEGREVEHCHGHHHRRDGRAQEGVHQDPRDVVEELPGPHRVALGEDDGRQPDREELHGGDLVQRPEGLEGALRHEGHEPPGRGAHTHGQDGVRHGPRPLLGKVVHCDHHSEKAQHGQDVHGREAVGVQGVVALLARALCRRGHAEGT
mmetsp:Transcript_67643/g.218460  ORF Transcript_67643/g.218460 Transcript_67643/m.218460 type:complete len:275 (-) Transcript_67643:96-920(-)